jgi:hypothetical protein
MLEQILHRLSAEVLLWSAALTVMFADDAAMLAMVVC